MITLMDINEDENNDKVVKSAYFNSLTRTTNELETLNENLNNMLVINKKKRNKYKNFINKYDFRIKIAIVLVSAAIAPLLKIATVIGIFLVQISLYVGYALFDFKKLKGYSSKDELIKAKVSALENIYNYLKSEQEIVKDMKYLLFPNTIYQLEDFIQNDIKVIKSYKKYRLQNIELINYKYVEGYKKNLIILDTIKNLDDNQKQQYLADIYSAITSCKTYSNDNMTNMINKNFEPIPDSLTLLTENKTVDDDNTTSQSTNTQLNNPVKPVSLRKEDYNLPYYNENGIFYIDGDPMPPLFQEEKGRQFSKKLPKP